MPRYFYKCKYCDVRVDTYHGMSEEERLKDCEYCNSINGMIRLPTSFSTEVSNSETKTGDVVKKAIEDFAEELKEEKKALANKDYDDIN